MSGKLSEHFNIREFECKCRSRGLSGYGYCGGAAKTDTVLIGVLEKMITDLTVDTGNRVIVNVTSGYRCAAYNKKVGGAPRSKHVEGTAADITVKYSSGDEIPPSEVAAYLDDTYPDKYGVGKYKRWTHIDVREGFARWHG